MRILFPLISLVFSGCLAALPANDSLPMEQACLISAKQTTPIAIQIARSPGERGRGLMGRKTLAPDTGMLFVYTSERPADYGFWMYQTLIPLDIAYLDRNGTIRNIYRMVPCPSDQARNCPTYPAGVSFFQALEMNKGFFESHGIEVGDRLSLKPSECR